MYRSLGKCIRSSQGVSRRRVGDQCAWLTGNGYLHETIIPTYHFQDSLPSLPIPKPEESLAAYLKSAEPLVSNEQFSKTKAIVEAFQATEANALQTELKHLMKTDFKGSSFISKWWFDMYLSDRAALPMNYNPQITFKDDPDPSKMDQAARAATLIHSSIAFYRTLRDRKLEPDLFHTKPHISKTIAFKNVIKFVPSKLSWYGGFLGGAYALDMSQYKNLFHSTRIPGLEKDEIQKTQEEMRHIVVQRGSDFFTFPVLTEDGDAVSHAEIEATLRSILSSPETGAPPVSMLTTMKRDEWFESRNKLQNNNTNKASLKEIDTAMFAVCLEDEGPEKSSVEEARSMLHGSGRNRWFDKSFQLIVNKNGRSAVNFEHSWGDGVAVLRYFEEVYKESIQQASLCKNALPKPSSSLKMLSWDLDDETVKTIDNATDAYDTFMKSISMSSTRTDSVYPKYLKQHDLGADGTFQMGFQLAHYKMHGYTASTYESASTAGFKHGRTETIRSATTLSDQFCKTMVDPSASVSDKEAALRAAVKNHGALTKDALTGKGWDRHLFALRKVAESKGLSCDMFTDETYAILNHIILSTSTLNSPALDGGGFGPVNKDCYGIMYGHDGDSAQFGVMSYHGAAQTQSFSDALKEGFLDIRAVLDSSSSSS